MKSLIAVPSIAAALLLSACGGGATNNTASATDTETTNDLSAVDNGAGFDTLGDNSGNAADIGNIGEADPIATNGAGSTDNAAGATSNAL